MINYQLALIVIGPFVPTDSECTLIITIILLYDVYIVTCDYNVEGFYIRPELNVTRSAKMGLPHTSIYQL